MKTNPFVIAYLKVLVVTLLVGLLSVALGTSLSLIGLI